MRTGYDTNIFLSNLFIALFSSINNMNIGITGKYASGKGEVAKILQEQGFSYYSLSDVIREELKKENKETSRENMTIKGNSLREEHGPGVLGKKMRELIKKPDNNILDSVRNPFEVNELRKLKNFHLLGIDAPIEMRLKRLQKRARAGDVKTLEELKAAEAKENKELDTNQQLDKTLSMADNIIMNDGSRNELKSKVLKVISEWQEEDDSK